jgi:hypothetical protein
MPRGILKQFHKSSVLIPNRQLATGNWQLYNAPMFQFFEYYGKYQGLRQRWGTMPSWAKFIVFLFALPGILLGVLSILVLVVSILALLLLTVPAYRILKALTVRPTVKMETEIFETGVGGEPVSPNRRQVEVTIIE